MPRERKYWRTWLVRDQYIRRRLANHIRQRDYWRYMIDFYYNKKPKGYKMLGWNAQAEWDWHNNQAIEWEQHQFANNSMMPHW